jgi:hypothetical protein
MLSKFFQNLCALVRLQLPGNTTNAQLRQILRRVTILEAQVKRLCQQTPPQQ